MTSLNLYFNLGKSSRWKDDEKSDDDILFLFNIRRRIKGIRQY